MHPPNVTLSLSKGDRRAALKPPDALLLGSVAFLVALGLVMVFSASSASAYMYHHDTAYYLKRQAVYLVIGVALAYAAYRVDYRKLRTLAPGVVMVTFVLLVLTLIPHVGFATGGARRWLGFHSVSFQPSELGKLALVLFLAAKLSQLGERVTSLSKGVGPALFITLLLAAPVFAEPDMGTASIYIFTAFAMLFTAGARIEHLIMCALVMLPGAALAVGSSAYKRARIFAFINPWKDAQNTGFHIVQSLLALGSGGLFGLGLGASRQKYFYLPEAHTDFIFAVLGEELGMLGCIAVIALFVTFAIRAVMLAIKAPGPLRDAARDGLHVPDRDPGVHQHRRRHVVVAGHRRPAPVHLVRRHLADRVARRRRPDRQRGPPPHHLTRAELVQDRFTLRAEAT